MSDKALNEFKADMMDRLNRHQNVMYIITSGIGAIVLVFVSVFAVIIFTTNSQVNQNTPVLAETTEKIDLHIKEEQNSVKTLEILMQDTKDIKEGLELLNKSKK